MKGEKKDTRKSKLADALRQNLLRRKESVRGAENKDDVLAKNEPAKKGD